MQSQLTIDQYISPSGPGWILTAKVIEGGQEYYRNIDFGPANMGTTGWVQQTRGN